MTITVHVSGGEDNKIISGIIARALSDAGISHIHWTNVEPREVKSCKASATKAKKSVVVIAMARKTR